MLQNLVRRTLNVLQPDFIVGIRQLFKSFWRLFNIRKGQKRDEFGAIRGRDEETVQKPKDSEGP